ncbi:hypothetical protein C343_02078 [Cryptococcus neoformans C23]|uniref:Uncharacterized protein n=1 Tax=Cryptococcus neoformans (strain H99 / ATCC 208821 / CBS 10515 / FGSC 9487) TaxID=235443 RepID=J9VII9_CRYN9|nr:hypothetical protein CNAG_02684 [Cryptococcus neoformans var. grubii H99]AUB23610.1 hypothetical protein CKF44_02684 [Cryptococcus neoformans var. grubii]OWZ33942.1 hypothetical protein C347_02146 [Cryptococcus neoformans var. grubii AD2-60a]OWZ46070.1 hypothetical protein C343_02078 [Cryptococcus neoformans var. grubii C23]OXC85709.1 hypothetical protein C344_01878 [Cryptococcus neoformans var. grubii AD1-7a]OXG37043.1 hypothetical protein C360_02168 [Cryptococcus neoformans var. grubii Bt|eukprot:XP_012048066.1 hypothetical protein CNAG_02684 [Cryptococcus neoformans var. grubii H99]
MTMIDMGMDTAWCLACSKQLDNPRDTYCSDACRLEDSQPSGSMNNHVDITAPVPAGFFPTSRVEARSDRPSLIPTDVFEESQAKMSLRDRRAYSFPAELAEPAVRRPGSRRQTQTQETLQFVRKSSGQVSGMNSHRSPNLGPTTVGAGGRPKGFGKLSKTTGNNTPIVLDSVFCSNSESSDNEVTDGVDYLRRESAILRKRLSKTTDDTLRLPRAPVPRRLSNNLGYEPSSYHSRPSLVPSHSHPLEAKPASPVAHIIATSAGSRSRDDIVSWLNEVKRSPKDTTLDSISRSQADMLTPTQERMEWVEEGKMGTTPQGRLGSALAGFSTLRGLSGIQTLANAASGSDTVYKAPPVPSHASSTAAPVSDPEGFALSSQVSPSQAEVSRVAVMNQPGGATPTLSTISLSDLMEPLTDAGENVDFMTDEQSASGSSSFARHRLSAVVSGSHRQGRRTGREDLQGKTIEEEKGAQTPSPLRPLANTAQAIWNISNYIRSFAPLSIASVLVPSKRSESPTPPASRSATAGPFPPRQGSSSSSSSQSQDHISFVTPLPAARQPSEPDQSPEQAMVRSLPMDIANPIGAENGPLERKLIREREQELDIDSDWSKNKSRSRIRGSRVRNPSPSRSRSRGRSDGRRSRAREMSKVRGSHSRHGRKISYDADASEGEKAGYELRRGRSRREKVLRMDSTDEEPQMEERRGRDRTVKA